MRVIVAVLAGIIGMGCAHDVSATFPGEVTKKTGTLIVLFSSAVPNATVSIDGGVACDDENTRKVVVAGVPSGKREVHVTASYSQWKHNIDHTSTVDIPSGGTGTVQLATPAQSMGAWIYGGGALVCLVVLVSL